MENQKHLNVDSPSFTPSLPSVPANGTAGQTTANRFVIPSKAANAAVFTPKTIKSFTPNSQTQAARTTIPSWSHQTEYKDFVPQGLESAQLSDSVITHDVISNFDSYSNQGQAVGNSLQAASHNPYSQDPSGLANATFFQNSGQFTQPLQHHLYAPSGPLRENLFEYQRSAHDFFIPEEIREDLLKKAETTRQTIPQSNLPNVESYHSLVALDTSHQRNANIFGYSTWVYKATSGADGHTYAIRRVEGYKLTSDQQLRAVQPWKRVRNANVVSVHTAFTTQAYGDSSLVFITDFHPLSKTVTEHFLPNRYQSGRAASQSIPEQDLWGYIVQLAAGIKAIHSNGLAAQVIHPSKVLVTSKGHLRLNACGVLDVLRHGAGRSLVDLQQDDLVQFGKLVLVMATHNVNAHLNFQKSMESLRHYSPRLKECISWLMTHGTTAGKPSVGGSTSGPSSAAKTIDIFLREIADQVMTVLDNTFHKADTLTSVLARELENGRLVRLLTKLNMINERPEFFDQTQWGESGDRYYLRLFRDYVFHQVDAQGAPVMDLGHVIESLNKLDAGSEERIVLTSRDDQTVMVVSYKELKRGFENSWQELLNAGG